MKKSFGSSNSKIFIYAFVIALILGACMIVLQDIKVPTEHVSNNIEVSLEK